MTRILFKLRFINLLEHFIVKRYLNMYNIVFKLTKICFLVFNK